MTQTEAESVLTHLHNAFSSNRNGHPLPTGDEVREAVRTLQNEIAEIGESAFKFESITSTSIEKEKYHINRGVAEDLHRICVYARSAQEKAKLLTDIYQEESGSPGLYL
jgi:hypothetical protein